MHTLTPKRNSSELTLIKSKAPDTRIVEALQRNKERAAQSHKPTIAQACELVNLMYYAKLQKLMPEGVRLNTEQYNANLIAGAPCFESYRRFAEQVKFTKEDVIRSVGAEVWNLFSSETQRLYLKARELNEAERKGAIRDIGKVFKAQYKLIHDLDDDRYLELEEIAERSTVSHLDRIETHILPDIERNPKHLMKPSDIVKYLIKQSQGFIVDYDRLNIGQELEKRGFEQENGRYFVDLVK